MEIQSLIRFLAIVDNGNFAAAARQLNITPQALSISISKLEKELGVLLFDRERGSSTQPTSFGDALVSNARAIVAAQQRAISELHAIRDGRAGWVRLGIGESMTGNVAARAVADLKREVPDARIVLVEGYTKHLIEELEHGEFDMVAGAPSHSFEPKPHLDQIFLYRTHDILAVRHQHPLAKKRQVTMEDMRPFTWMVPFARSDTYKAVLTAYIEKDLRPPESFIFSDTFTVGSYLLSHEDYILMVTPDLLWESDDRPLFKILPVAEPTLERHACLIHRNDLPLNPLALLLREKLVAVTAPLREADMRTAPGRARSSIS